MRVLVAGITGQLGHGLVELAQAGVELVPALRRIGRRDPRTRLARTFRDAPELAERALEADVTEPLWGIDPDAALAAGGAFDAVLNLAGETNWAAPGRRLSAVNVLGAVEGQRLAAALAAGGEAPLYAYASSIHAAGAVLGRVPEQPFEPNAQRTPYEQAKWLGEQRLLDASRRDAGVPLLIARIGGLVGSSRTGATAKRNSLYMLADRWESLPGGVLPLAPRGRVDMLPRDVAAELLLRALQALVERPPASPAIVHVCAGEAAPTSEELVAAVRAIADGSVGARRSVRVPARALVWASQNLDRFSRLGAVEQNALIGLRYLSLDRVFERDALRALVGGPLPRPTAQELARLAFEVPGEPELALAGADPALARFAG